VIVSQNAVFVGPVSVNNVEHPRGGGIARLISTGLPTHGYRSSQIDNWRDSGWSISLNVGDATLEIIIASLATVGEWMIQVASADQPGWLARLFGARPVDRSPELFDVASTVHRILVGAGYRGFRWCADGFPDSEGSSPEPLRAYSGRPCRTRRSSRPRQP
jgi:hypothetical protein